MFSLIKSINRWFVFFRVLGLGVTNEPLRKERFFFNKNNLFFVLRLSIVVGDACLLYKFHRHIYFYQDAMGAINDLIKYTATVLATINILCASHLNGNQLQELTQLAIKFQEEILSLMSAQDLVKHNKKFWRGFRIRIVSFSLLFAIFEFAVLPFYWTNHVYKSSFFFLIGNFIFILICRYRHWQHMLFMNLVHHQLELLVKVLSDGRAWSAVKLQQLKELYEIPVEMVGLQNEYFGSSQAINLIFNHMQLLGDAYWMYWRYLNGGYSPGSFSKGTYKITKVFFNLISSFRNHFQHATLHLAVGVDLLFCDQKQEFGKVDSSCWCRIDIFTFLFSSCPTLHIGCTAWREEMELPLFWQVNHVFIIIPQVNS